MLLAGIKLMRITYDSLPNSEDTTHYVGPFHYGNNQLDFWFAPEGRILNEDTVFAYEYVLTDHLGNTRATFVEDGGTALLTQSNHYYPFGLEIASLNYTATPGADYDYLYNGKELQEFNDLNWHDYGARFYDASVGRWGAIDPLADQYYPLSPYNYVYNSPILYTDPTGMNGELGGSGTEEDPYVISATYIHHGLEKEQQVGLERAVSDMNRMTRRKPQK